MKWISMKFFKHPTEIKNFISHNWDYRKFFAFYFLTGYLYGFSFFWSNFNVELNFSNCYIGLLLPLAGVLILSFLILPFSVILLVGLRIIEEKKKLKIDISSQENLNINRNVIISKINRSAWIRSYLYSIITSLFCVLIFISIIALIAYILNQPFISTYIFVYGRAFAFLWGIILCLAINENLDVYQKYRVNLLILISFFTAYLIVNILFIEFEHFMKDIFLM